MRAATVVAGIISIRALGAFLPATTLWYWQAWAMLGVMAVGEGATHWYLVRRDPALLERRLGRESRGEGSTRQNLLATVVRLGVLGAIIVAALDHREGWSRVAAPLWVLGDALIALGLFVVWLAFRANSFAAATVRLEEDQRVVSHGPYGRVRHPMYSGCILTLIGIPLALDSLWGLVPAGLAVVAILGRLLEEERFLDGQLAGYREYRGRVRYRVAPMVW